MAHQNSSAQSLDKYVDQLYFGVLSHNPDTIIKGFLSKYAPALISKINTADKWDVYPPDNFIEPRFKTVTNSFVFYSHPYFDEYFNSGQLSITQKIYNEPNWFDNISDIKLWFEFDNEMAAKQAYKRLVDKFSSFHVLKRLSSENGMDKAEFTDTISERYYSHIQVVVAEDSLPTTKYSTLVEKGCEVMTGVYYKVFLKIGNDLY